MIEVDTELDDMNEILLTEYIYAELTIVSLHRQEFQRTHDASYFQTQIMAIVRESAAYPLSKRTWSDAYLLINSAAAWRTEARSAKSRFRKSMEPLPVSVVH